jgi:hypothetical protein
MCCCCCCCCCQAHGPESLANYPLQPLSWQEVQALAGPGTVGLPLGYTPSVPLLPSQPPLLPPQPPLLPPGAQQPEALPAPAPTVQAALTARAPNADSDWVLDGASATEGGLTGSSSTPRSINDAVAVDGAGPCDGLALTAATSPYVLSAGALVAPVAAAGALAPTESRLSTVRASGSAVACAEAGTERLVGSSWHRPGWRRAQYVQEAVAAAAAVATAARP